MSLPNFPKELNHLNLSGTTAEGSVLAPEDEDYLKKLTDLIRSGKRAVILVEGEEDNKLKFMFSNASRAEVLAILGKVVEHTSKKLIEEEKDG